MGDGGHGMNKLKVLATPIGNLGDLSSRGKEALEGADLILAEDSRVTRKLEKVVTIRAKILRCDQHRELQVVDTVLEALMAGEQVVLTSDAGCPGLSDPGGRLIEALLKHGQELEVVPGPSALTAALMGVGLPMNHFAFLGFLPRQKKARESLLRSIFRSSLGLVIFESPKRTQATLKDLHQVYGDAPVVVARELTKEHETFHRGRLGVGVSPPLVERGEIVIVVSFDKNEVGRSLCETMNLHEASQYFAGEKKAFRQWLQEIQGLERSRAYDIAEMLAVSKNSEEEART